MAENSFDVVVIGGGPGGYVCAIRAAQLGLKTACVEYRGSLGGTCLNVGCIPSKALLESSEVFDKVNQHGAEYGLRLSGLQADVKAMIDRKNKIVTKFTRGIEGLFKKNKVTYLRGFGRFVDANHVKVSDDKGEEQTIEARHVVIATGSAPIEIPIAKFDGEVVVTSTEALDFNPPPQHLIVIGGGVIGLELGSVWKRLGSKVTVIEAMDSILANMDKSVSQNMTKLMKTQGLELKTATKVTQVSRNKDKAIVTAQNSDGEIEIEGDKVLVAVGRRPFTDKLNLDSLGVNVDERGRVIVNEHLQTAISNIYAIGDVIRGPMLAHKAEEEGVAVAELIAGKPGHVNYEAIPNVIYTWPEVASVGLTEQECAEQGREVNIGQFPFVANGRAACSGTVDGFVKLIADKRTDRLLGAHLVGPNASELVAEIAVAFEFGASAEDIARSVHAHPTLAEVIKEAALAVDKRALHI